MKATWKALIWMAALIAAVVVVAAEAADSKNKRVDLLVIAPHPDDEVIGCSGIIQQALETDKTVAVVVMTNSEFGRVKPVVAAAWRVLDARR